MTFFFAAGLFSLFLFEFFFFVPLVSVSYLFLFYDFLIMGKSVMLLGGGVQKGGIKVGLW